MKRGTRVLELAKNLGLLVATLVVGAGALELGTRLFTNVPPPLGRRNAVVGQTYLPGFEGRVFAPEGGREVLLRFNREGFRGADVSVEKAEDVRRVAVIGDSFVASLACDEEKTAVRQLERLLNESHPEVRWEVMNFGVSGASTGQEMVLYRHTVARYRPDLVLCAYFMGNDFEDNSPRMSSNPRVYFDLDEDGRLVQLPFSAARSRRSVWLNRNSRFYVWYKQANDMFFWRARVMRGSLEPGHWIFCRKRTEELENAWELNTRLIGAFHAEVESRGARFALVLYPCGEQVYEDRWQKVLDAAGESAEDFDRDYPEERLIAYCKAHRIPVAPITGEFRRADPHDLLFFGGNGHLNDAGNLQAARAIHGFLTDGEGREVLREIIE